jgi:hypothetical protein
MKVLLNIQAIELLQQQAQSAPELFGEEYLEISY